MNESSELPPLLQTRMRRLERRVRLGRLARGVAGGAILLCGLVVAMWLFEVSVGWSVSGLRAANVVLFGTGAMAALTTCLSWRRRIAWTHLAALVERRFTELDERLLSTIELQQAAFVGHGAPELIARLRSETVAHADAKDFQQAVSLRATWRLACASLGLLVITALPLFASDACARFGRRLAWAWSSSVYGFQIEVAPGTQYVGRGRTAVVRTRVTATETGARLPADCTLVMHEQNAAPRRQRMEPSDDGTFTFTWAAVERDLTYRVEAGELASATYRLDVVEPATLRKDGISVQVAPPPYVNSKVMPVVAATGTLPFTALQYSRLRFEFALDHPALKAMIRQRGDNAPDHVLPLDETRTMVQWNALALDLGPQAAVLVLEAEHGITTTYPLPAWSVWADDAPWFSPAPALGMLGNEDRPKMVAPGDLIPIQTVVEDQVGLGRIELEYKVNDRPTQLLLLADGHGQTRAAIDFAWSLSGIAKVGDVIQCRLRAADNRRLGKNAISAGGRFGPVRDLTPNVTFLPARDQNEDSWWSLRLDAKADAFAKQEIAAQRDEFQQWIERIRKQLIQEQQQVQKVRLASHQQPVLTFDQAQALGQAQKLNQANQQELAALGQKAASIVGLQNLARLALDIARRELGDSDRALTASVAKSLAAERREQELTKAEQALQGALKRLDEMSKMNDLLAQDRLDGRALDKLAQQEDALAKQTEELAAQPAPDAKEMERLRAEQEKIAAELQIMAEKNPRLKAVGRRAQQAQAQKLAKAARNLAMNQRKMSEEAEAKALAERKSKFADLAGRQRELAGRVEKLDGALKDHAATAILRAPHRPALDAADQLRDGRIEAALVPQDAAEVGLRKLGDEVEQALAAGRAPRGAVLKLAKQQVELLKQLEKIGDDFPRLGQEELGTRLSALEKGQKALGDAAAKLDTPATGQAAKQAAQQSVAEASDLVRRKDLLAAHAKMEQARDALQAWAQAVPDTPPAGAKETAADTIAKKHADQARQLAKEQRELRDATRKLLDDLMKAQSGAPGAGDHKQDVDKLVDELMKFAQKSGPESKQAAGDAAHAAEMAKKAMAKSDADKKDGKFDDAKKNDDEAALQLEMAAKKADETAQAMAEKDSQDPKNDTDDAALQKSFEDSQMKLEQAQQKLSQKPSSAAGSMKQAAQALKQTAKLAQQRPGTPQAPTGGGASPAQNEMPGGASPSGDPLQQALQAHAGKTWGELPGELRTRIVQDLRARYGDEYGPIIQRYFQQIAETPGGKKAK